MKTKFNQNQLIIRITASCFILLLAVILFAPIPTYANVEVDEGLDIIQQETGLQGGDPRAIIGGIIKAALGLLGAVALSIVIYAGFVYMTAGGDAGKVDKAKAWLKNGAIGLTIIIFSYSITSYIFNAWLGIESESSPYEAYYSAKSVLGGKYGVSNGAFGDVIQNHYPKPDQTDVARNAMILVTFKVPVELKSVVDLGEKGYCPDGLDDETMARCGSLQPKAFKVSRLADIEGNSDFASDDKLVPGYALVTEDSKTIVFDPYGDDKANHLGSSFDDVEYRVYLSQEIRRQDDTNKPIFAKVPNYMWHFTTGTVLDITPPQITSVSPLKQKYPVEPASELKKQQAKQMVDEDGLVYLNETIIVNFDEPVIPPIIQIQNCTNEDTDNEVQITGPSIVGDCNTNHVAGNWKVGLNGYQSIQFISSTLCEGVEANSCGDPVYCLPSDAKIEVKALAAILLDGDIAIPGTGLMDLAGNSLDGNADGQSTGPGVFEGSTEVDASAEELALLKDNYFWNFQTGEALELSPPYIIKVTPNNQAQHIDVSAPIKADFNELMDPSSIEGEFKLIGQEFGLEYNRWVDANMGKIVTVDDDGNVEEFVDLSSAWLSHADFIIADIDEGDAPQYTPILTSKIKDSKLNCFNPTQDSLSFGDVPVVAGSECQNLPTGMSCCPETGTYKLKAVNEDFCTAPWEK